MNQVLFVLVSFLIAFVSSTLSLLKEIPDVNIIDSKSSSITIVLDRSTDPPPPDFLTNKVEFEEISTLPALVQPEKPESIFYDRGFLYVSEQHVGSSMLKSFDVVNHLIPEPIQEIKDGKKIVSMKTVGNLDLAFIVGGSDDRNNSTFICRNSSLHVTDLVVDSHNLIYISTTGYFKGLLILNTVDENGDVTCNGDVVGKVEISSEPSNIFLQTGYPNFGDKYIYLVTEKPSEEVEIAIIDVKYPTPYIITLIDNLQNVQAINVFENYCYVATSAGINIYDITEKNGSVKLVGQQLGMQFNRMRLDAVGSLLFMCQENFFNVQIGDVSEPSELQMLATIQVPNQMCYGMTVFENYFYWISNTILYVYRFDNLTLHGSQTGVKESCDRAFKLQLIVRDDNSVLKPSFFLDIKCSLGPSIISFPPENSTANLGEKFSLYLPMSDYYGTEGVSTVTISPNITYAPEWLYIFKLNSTLSHSGNYCSTSSAHSITVEHNFVAVASTNCFEVIVFKDMTYREVLMTQNELYSSSSIVKIKSRGDRLIVADENKVSFYRVDPDIPKLTTDIVYLNRTINPTGGFLKITDIEVNKLGQNHYVFVLDRDLGFFIFDYTDSNKIELVNFKSKDSLGLGGYDLEKLSLHGWEEKILYVAGGNKFCILNVDNPYSINLLKTVTRVSVNTIFDIYAYKNHLFVVDNMYVEIYDNKIKNNPSLITEYLFTGNGKYIIAQGMYAFVITQDDGVFVLDYHNPKEHIRFENQMLKTIGEAEEIIVVNGYIHIVLKDSANGYNIIKMEGISVEGKPEYDKANPSDISKCKDGVLSIHAADAFGVRSKEIGISVVEDTCRNKIQHNPIVTKPNDKPNEGLSALEIVSISVGGACFIALLIFLFCFFLILCCLIVIVIIIVFCCSGSGICGFLFLKAKDQNKMNDLGRHLLVDEGEEKHRNPEIIINKKMFEIKFKKIKLLNVIGAGGGGAIIYKAKWKGQIVCVKLFKRIAVIDEKQENYDEFEREMSVMASISHPNILRWYGCTLQYPSIGIVMDFCENSDLQVCIIRKKFESMEESLRICKEICLGMSYLHDRRIIHRDLKPQNVLLDKDYIVKIMDFGLSRSVSDTTMMTKSIGTCYFMAPELVMDQNYSLPVDVFAYSILIFIVLSKNLQPYGENTGYRCEFKVAQNPLYRPEMSEEIKNKVKDAGFGWLLDVMVRGWGANPDERPTFSEIEDLFDEDFEKRESMVIADGEEEVKLENNEDDFILNTE